ncbi:MAG: hypothetical protein ACTSPQ_18790 [Candidatus Helarchaeota archaeon]
MIINPEKIKSILKFYYYISLVLNISTVILHIIAEFFVSIIQEFTAFLIITVFFLNIFLIIINFKIINRDNKEGKFIKNLIWIYLIFIIYTLYSMANYHISIALMDKTISISDIILFFVGIYGFYGFGIFISLIDVLNADNESVWRY